MKKEESEIPSDINKKCLAYGACYTNQNNGLCRFCISFPPHNY